MLHSVKVRRVGNSNVVPLPQQLEASGFTPGTSVLIEETGAGALILRREDQLPRTVLAVGERLLTEHQEAFQLLEALDRGEAIAADGEVRRIDADRRGPR